MYLKFIADCAVELEIKVIYQDEEIVKYSFIKTVLIKFAFFEFNFVLTHDWNQNLSIPIHASWWNLFKLEQKNKQLMVYAVMVRKIFQKISFQIFKFVPVET